MTRHMRMRLGAGAVVLLTLFLLSGAHLCEVALDKGASDPGMRPIGNGAIACAEFWFNRYQTLIGALVAVFAAFLAYYGVKSQVNSAEAQVRVGRRQSSIAFLEVINSTSDDVHVMSRQVAFINSRMKLAEDHRMRAIESMRKMVGVVENPIELRNEYSDRFERIVRAHKSLILAIEKNVDQAKLSIDKALISSDSKAEIQDYLFLSNHAIAVQLMAKDTFSEVVQIFDESRTKMRQRILENKIIEAEGLVIIPNMQEHPGYKMALLAEKNLAEVFDQALRDAEGRNI